MPHFKIDISQVIILIFTLLFSRLCYLLFLHPLSTYPGPKLACITNLWRFINFYQGAQHITDHDLHKKYGPIVRVGPDSLLFGDIATYQAIYGFNPKVEKGDFYLMVGDPDRKKHVVFQARTEEEHRWKRSRLVPFALGQKNVARYEESLSKIVRRFVEKIEDELGKGKYTIDISQIMKRLTMDTTLDVVWGNSHGFLDVGFDKNGSIKAKDEVTRMSFGLPFLPWLTRIFTTQPIWGYMTQRPQFDSEGNPTGLTALFVHLRTSFAKLLDPNSHPDRPSIASTLLSVPSSDKRKIQDPEDLFRECINFTFAGQGSTAAALTTVLHDLALPSNADWQFQIRESLAALPLTISTGTTAPGINVSLQCFLRESWRLSPPLPAPFERVIARGAETSIPGLKGPLPVGTRVASNLYVIMRLKEVFGEDADVFRANRWMEGTDGERKRMEDAWAVFGRGSRACAGKEIAVMVVKMVIAEILMRWEIRSKPDDFIRRNNFEMHYDSALLTFTPLQEQLHTDLSLLKVL